MDWFTKVAIGLLATLQFLFLVLEMFYWAKPLGLKVFRQSLEKANSSIVLAKNQGLYNGFLAAGLIWGIVHPNPAFGAQIEVFFLTCVAIAGIYGALTVNKRIFYIQALPAIVDMGLVFYSGLLFTNWPT